MSPRDPVPSEDPVSHRSPHPPSSLHPAPRPARPGQRLSRLVLQRTVGRATGWLLVRVARLDTLIGA